MMPLLGSVNWARRGRPCPTTYADVSLSSALESLVVPAKSSIGHTILQKLGWRPGQGIGPRVTLRKLRIQEGKLGRVRAGLETEVDDSAEASKHTYAPRDTRLLVYDSKSDKEGLGYEKGRGMGAIRRKRPGTSRIDATANASLDIGR